MESYSERYFKDDFWLVFKLQILKKVEKDSVDYSNVYIKKKRVFLITVHCKVLSENKNDSSMAFAAKIPF